MSIARPERVTISDIARRLDISKASVSYALNGRPGETGVPIQVVQNNLGHASIGTTSGYLTTERDMRLAAMRGFGAKRH